MFEKDDYKKAQNAYYKVSEEKSSDLLFDNLEWLTTKEAASYLRKSVGAVHTLVSRGQIRARKFRNRLYFKQDELSYLIETSHFRGGI